MSKKIPFNKPSLSGRELEFIQDAVNQGQLSGDGPYTKKCHLWLQQATASSSALLTHSCTAALEMAAILLDLSAGDEVIMPSYTFVSTANAVVMRGATPVFIDIEASNLNIDPDKIEQAITAKTKAIFVVHYAGVICDMVAISAIAKKHSLYVIEDAAQAILSSRYDKPAGSFGDLACFSFHETKNIISGEGGALTINNDKFKLRAEIIREKGTNRSQFFRGAVDKYTWVDIGSSYLPGELIAAFLYSQLIHARDIINNRISIWNRYHQALAPLEEAGLISRPNIPLDCKHNAHLYYLLLPDNALRQALIEKMKRKGIVAPFHYVPLHSSPAGKKFSRVSGSMSITNDISGRLLRLPLYPNLDKNMNLDFVIDSLINEVEQLIQ